jgi:DNA (cytosine-5)-methyltransferase 1
MSRPKLLDLYCGAGGAAKGYHDAGFDVTGVDLSPQPRFPFKFVEGDCLVLDPKWIRRNFDAVHASPTCQAHTKLKTMHNARPHLDLIPGTRAILEACGLPWIIENVVGAPLIDPIILCGTMFGLAAGELELQRHRQFEANFKLYGSTCRHHGRGTIGIYGDHIRDRRRRAGSQDRGRADPTFADGCKAMGIDWMQMTELCQSIPPAYTSFLGAQLRYQVETWDLIG